MAKFRKDPGVSPVFLQNKWASRDINLDRKTVLHKNSQTDAVKGDDFRLAVLPVKSRTPATLNGKDFQKYHACFVHLHGHFPHNE